MNGLIGLFGLENAAAPVKQKRSGCVLLDDLHGYSG
jgi:hypothetical protein